jgi:hypothetical protein
MKVASSLEIREKLRVQADTTGLREPVLGGAAFEDSWWVMQPTSGSVARRNTSAVDERAPSP